MEDGGTSRAPDNFRDLVYAMVRRIPRTRVASYGQIAQWVGYPNHARLVGTCLKVCFPLTFLFFASLAFSAFLIMRVVEHISDIV